MKFSTVLLLVASASAITIKSKNSEEGASLTDDQVKQFKALSDKLGLDMSDDMMVGQSAEDVSNAIIGAALESGKSQDEIEAAMGGQWSVPDILLEIILFKNLRIIIKLSKYSSFTQIYNIQTNVGQLYSFFHVGLKNIIIYSVCFFI